MKYYINRYIENSDLIFSYLKAYDSKEDAIAAIARIKRGKQNCGYESDNEYYRLSDKLAGDSISDRIEF